MYKKICIASGFVACALMLTSCASIVNGTHQPVAVNTTPISGANCKLSNDKGEWYVNNTPGTTVVKRSYKDLKVVCSKNGYAKSFKMIPSKTKAMAFGNLIFGGVIGAGVDVANGAAYDYPNDIFMPMDKIG